MPSAAIEFGSAGVVVAEHAHHRAIAHRQHIGAECGIVAVAHHQGVAVGIFNVAIGGGIGICEGVHSISIGEMHIVDAHEASLPFFQRFGIGLQVADIQRHGVHLSRVGQSVDFGNALESGEREESGFPHTAAFIVLRIAHLLLTIVFAHEAVFHINHHFLAHTVSVVEAVAINRHGKTGGAVGNVEAFVDVAAHIVGSHPTVNHDIFFHGVDVVVFVLPIFCFKFGEGHIGHMSCLRHHHRRSVELFVTTREEAHPEKQNAQIYKYTFHNVCDCFLLSNIY